MALIKNSKIKDNRSKNLVTIHNPRSPISEQFRTVRTNVQYSSVDQELQTIMITSTGAVEGKSTIAANLSVVFAQQKKKVLLVDADLRRPTAHYTFQQNNTFGLTSVLTKKTTLTKAVQKTDEENLYILTSGPLPPNPAELLSSNAMEKFIEEVKEEFDTIIFDTPPMLAVADSQILANQCDGSILVVFSGKTEVDKAKKVKDMLVASRGKFLGVVLNHVQSKKDDYYYYYG